MNRFLMHQVPAHCRFVLSSLLTLSLLTPGHLNAESPRIRVGEDLSEASDMKGCLLATATAAGSEDLDGFLGHFTTGTQRKLRKKTAMLFVQHEFALEVVDCHVIECSEKKGELAVRYRATLSERHVDVVAVLDMRRENGYWKISREQVKTMQQSSAASCSPSRTSYLGGGEIAMR